MYFTQYLLSACWKKLHWRFCSWQRLGLIQAFKEHIDILEAHLDMIGKLAGPKDTFSEWDAGDRTLLNFLYSHRNGIFGRLLPRILPSNMHPQPRSPVFDKFHDAVVHAYDKNDLRLLYTKKTALGFHYLVYCVFLMASQVIKLIKDPSQPLWNTGASKRLLYPESVDMFKSHIKAAILPMKFLQFVLSSMVFKHHIGVWTNNEECLAFLLLSWMEKINNLTFGKRWQIMVESKKSS